MAKVNHFELSPTKTGQGVEQAATEEEVEAGSDDERAADRLNASLRSSKKQPAKEQQSNGILQTIATPFKYFGLLKQSTPQDVDSFFYPPKDSTDEGGQGTTDADEAEDVQNGTLLPPRDTVVIEESQELSHPFNSVNIDVDEAEMDTEERVASVPLTRASNKRKVDIYEPDGADPENLEEVGEVEESAPKHTKRVRRSKKAKPPLAWQATQRDTRANTQTMAKEPASMKSPSRKRLAVEIHSGSSEPAPKRRGRPRKAQPPQSKVPKQRTDGNADLGNEEVTPGDEVEMPTNGEEAPDGGNGLSDIFLAPSPVKPPISPASKSLNSRRRFSQPHNRVIDGASSAQGRQISSISDDSEEDNEDDEDVVGANIAGAINEDPDVAEDDDDRGGDAELPTKLSDVFPIEQFEDMLKTVQQVGQKQDKATQEWKVVHTESIAFSVPGKRMMKRLERLIKIYTALPTLRAAGGADAEKNQDKAVELVGSILEHAEVIFNERLGSKAHGVPQQELTLTRTMLRDVYFLLVPNIVKVLKLAVEAYQDEEIADTKTTKQVIDILSLLARLGQRAASQPKDVQLKENGRYRTSAPTRSIIKDIRKLLKTYGMELRRIKLAKNAEAWDAEAPERERKRAAQEGRELMERNRERKEIHKQQREAFEAQLNAPGIYGFFLRKELGIGPGQEGQRLGGRPSQLYRSSQRSSAQNLEDDDVDMSVEGDNPDVRDEPGSRMTPLLINASGSNVLGSKRSNKHHGPKKLSNREREVLIHTLRVEDKAYRYQLAAHRLGRDMEEIVEFAKVFQESMDKEHENGRWNKEGDEWTYDIWVDRA
ncbi:hypothetical protein D0Z07_7988 [Hyphodiscus hymeniophilus]|uniref:Uncharacterized protein n=1 Tax=Hyphodiscus hymeniophilus TaxID=353542 RepID=A0A9P6SKJ0_9HELO|nr:hypothetical protein D0Z07_7988 [Hyphodiscus hymeniophilus]